MAKLEASFSVTGIDQVKDLLHVLADNFDDLPIAVQDAIKALDEDPTVIDHNYLSERGVFNCSVYIDGKLERNVKSAHRVGRLVRYFQSIAKPDRKADSVWIVSGGQFICGWGEKPNIEGVK